MLTDELLFTIVKEVESLLSGRPLTHDSTYLADEEVLTPNHFLLGRPNPNLPPHVFVDREVSSRKRWRQALVLTVHIWKRWLRNYVFSLMESRKWTKDVRNLEKGNVVLVVDPHSPRGVWP